MRTVSFAGIGIPFVAHITDQRMMEKFQRYHPEHHNDIVEMLGIDLNRIMHPFSDGQRKRVHNQIGLMRPFKLILLDEITISLDICVRKYLLHWIIK